MIPTAMCALCLCLVDWDSLTVIRLVGFERTRARVCDRCLRVAGQVAAERGLITRPAAAPGEAVGRPSRSGTVGKESGRADNATNRRSTS